MAKYFKRQGIEEFVSYLSKNKAIKKSTAVSQIMANKVMLYLLPLLIFSPVLYFTVVLSTWGYFIKEFYFEFLQDERKINRYQGLFAPKTSSEALAIIGYQVHDDELSTHIDIVKNDDSASKKKIGDKQNAMLTWKNRWRWIGLDKKTLTTHLHIVAKTGAGKTELVRSIANDACFKVGGGLLFLDGKSDTKMLREFVNQATRLGRETSIAVINFLKGEFGGESNTFSPLNIMHPVKTVEFLGSLISSGNMDGSTQYFFEQGKSMLFGVTNATHARNKYFKEGYNLEKIFDNSKVQNMTLLRIMMYCMCRQLNEEIEASPVLKSATSTVPMVATDENLRYIELIVAYITDNPTKTREFKKELGIDYMEVKEIYVNAFTMLDGYLSKMWNQYSPQLDVISRTIYGMGKGRGLKFFGPEGINITEVKALLQTLKDYTLADEFDKLNSEYLVFDAGYVRDSEKSAMKTALHRAVKDGGSIDAPPADAIQQLAYASQQWSSLASIFAFFRHVFGQTNPEIEAGKLLKDNMFLYVLLPPLDVSNNYVTILGKMILATVREVASIALLGKDLSLHSTLANIHRDKLTPKPFTFIVLDEYGAYPISGLDILLAQLRSLSISVAVSTQDNASLMADGSNTTSQQKALANTTKIIPKVEDKEVIEWVRGMLSDVNIEKPKLQKDHHGNWAETSDIEVVQEKSFDVERLRDFGNGFALMLLGSKEEDLVYLQSFYRGGKAETISIKRYVNLGLE